MSSVIDILQYSYYTIGFQFTLTRRSCQCLQIRPRIFCFGCVNANSKGVDIAFRGVKRSKYRLVRIQHTMAIRLHINSLCKKSCLSLECVKHIHTICNIKRHRFLHDSSGTYGMERVVKYSIIHYVSVP